MSKFEKNDRVIHRNKGMIGGNGQRIETDSGTVLSTNYEGFGFMGHTYTALVRWDDGEEFRVNQILLQHEGEKREEVYLEALKIF